RPASEPVQPRQPPTRRNDVRGAVELKPAVTPAGPDSTRAVGTARQRELERGQIKPETQSAAAGRPTRPAPSKQVEKPTTPPSEKPDVRKRGESKKKADDKKKSEESPTP